MYWCWGECDCVWERCDCYNDWWDCCFKEITTSIKKQEQEKEQAGFKVKYCDRLKMLRNWTVYGLVLIYFAVYLVIWSINNYHKQSNTFPKIVWTYCDSNMPDSVTTLINQWKYLNPTWIINVL